MQRESAVDAFVDNLREAIRFRGTSIGELAKSAGVGRASLYRVLGGEERITLDRADKLAEALGMELSDLLTGKFPIRA